MKVNPPAMHDGPPDAIIVIFGAAVRPDGRASQTLRYRVDAAARFGARFSHPLFIPTGAKGRYGDAEATVMARQLIDAGFSPDAIVEEKTGTDTLSSVLAVVQIIRGVKIGADRARVYACTSAYHLPRCLLLLRMVGLRPRICPPPKVPAATTLSRRWFWRLRESAAFPYDALLMTWLRIVGRA